MEGLIGTASLSKKGLMPIYRVMGNLYNDGSSTVKMTIKKGLSFTYLLSIAKGHEAAGNSVILISGYHGGVRGTSLLNGRYFEKISYKTNEEGNIDIYLETSAYVDISILCIGANSSNPENNIPLYSLIPRTDIPGDITEITI